MFLVNVDSVLCPTSPDNSFGLYYRIIGMVQQTLLIIVFGKLYTMIIYAFMKINKICRNKQLKEKRGEHYVTTFIEEEKVKWWSYISFASWIPRDTPLKYVCWFWGEIFTGLYQTGQVTLYIGRSWALQNTIKLSADKDSLDKVDSGETGLMSNICSMANKWTVKEIFLSSCALPIVNMQQVRYFVLVYQCLAWICF